MQTSQKCHGLLKISHYLILKCHNSVTFQKLFHIYGSRRGFAAAIPRRKQRTDFLKFCPLFSAVYLFEKRDAVLS